MKQFISKFLFFILGWKIVGPTFFPKRCVIISAPHTSNWDFFYGRCYTYIIKLKGSYLMKSELFRPLIGWFFRLNGGIPVYRNTSTNFVDQIVQIFAEREDLVLGIAPEGTRSRVEKWKTGFYYIAKSANVPLVLVAMDYKNKTIGVVKTMDLTNNIDHDLSIIEEVFRNVSGRIPENYNPKIF